MSTLDDLIAQLHVVREQVNDSLFHLAGLKSSTEEVLGTYEAVGAEGMAAQAAQIVDDVEGSEATTQSTVPQIEAVIAQAEALKTGGQAAGGAGSNETTASGSDSKPEYIVTTGADRTPTPIDALPGHLREPSRKVGDPVEPPHEISKGNDGGKSKFGRFGRALSRDAEGLADYGSDLTESATAAKSDWKPVQPHEYQAITVVPQYQAPVHSGPQVAPEDVVGSSIIMTAVIVEGTSRLFKRLRGNDRGE